MASLGGTGNADDNIRLIQGSLRSLIPQLSCEISRVKGKAGLAANRFLTDEYSGARVLALIQVQALIKRLLEVVGLHASGPGLCVEDVSPVSLSS